MCCVVGVNENLLKSNQIKRTNFLLRKKKQPYIMPSQENFQFCESPDSQTFSCENDSRSLNRSLRLKNESVEQQPPSVQSHKGFPRTDENDYSNENDVSGGNGKQISTHELNSETVCAHIYIFCIYICINDIWCLYMCACMSGCEFVCVV